jgi:hypothetical protein
VRVRFCDFAFKRVFNGIVPEKKIERKKSDFLCNGIRKKGGCIYGKI